MKTINLQDVFLNAARKERKPVTIYLMNGFQFRGIVKGFDNFTIVLDNDGKQSLVFQHAVSTIISAKNIQIFDENNALNNEDN